MTRDFITRQFKEIKNDPFAALARKSPAILTIPLSFIMVLLSRLLRPLITVRFGTLISNRVGHLTVNTEIYLCERDAGLHDTRALDIFRHAQPVCNAQLKKMWDLRLCTFNFPRWVEPINRALPGGVRHQVALPADRDVHNLLCLTPAHLAFSQEEEHIGNKALLSIGVKPGAPFVCFHARDSAYLEAVRPFTDWGYHDYRDYDIQDSLAAVEELTRRGYFAFRMGAVVEKPLVGDNPMIIDYAVKYRTDFLDIYLPAKCAFFLCAPCGISGIPMIFRRPVAYVNFIPIGHLTSWNSYDLIIPKKLRKNGRDLSFREILDSGAGEFLSSGQYASAGIEVINNTAEEIAAVAAEMDERLKGSWRAEAQDEQLQEKFRSLFRPGSLHGKILARIGAEFLRQNRQLLR